MPSTRYQIHGDESSQTGSHHYMVIGSVLTPFAATHQLDAALTNAIGNAGHTGGELKWDKVRKHNLKIYEAVVDQFLSEITLGRAWFNAIVLDREQLKHNRYNAGDGELGFSKFIYQHLLKYARLHPDGEFYVYLDRRATRQHLGELRNILNAGARKKYGSDDPYRIIQFKDSPDSRIIQVADVMIGAIAYVLNGHGQREGAAPAKLALAEIIQSRKPLVPAFHVNTHISKKAFNIWHFRLSE